jgi:nitrite reductase/ring-hydroxylating ferredoxin subunit/RimJ/RimL family protein N-acetyltransferase
MNKAFVLSSSELPVTLHAIGPSDLEDLRLWKNANKQAFFFKREISPEGQLQWFNGYLSRPEDFMFIVRAQGVKTGCMGFRIDDGYADCYNIIGAPEGRGKGYLGQAMRLMCSFIQGEHAKDIGCRVLIGNPARSWYEKCGFAVIGTEPDHCLMRLVAGFKPCVYGKEDEPDPGPEFYSVPIELDRLRPGEVNCVRLDEGLELLVIPMKDGLKIARDLCVHMGAPLSAGKYCASEATLQCPWHGYLFSAETGELKRNPNDEIFAPLKKLYASYKPEKKPKYRLHMLPYKVIGHKAYVRRGTA